MTKLVGPLVCQLFSDQYFLLNLAVYFVVFSVDHLGVALGHG